MPYKKKEGVLPKKTKIILQKNLKKYMKNIIVPRIMKPDVVDDSLSKLNELLDNWFED